MPVIITDSKKLPLTNEQVEALWQNTIAVRQYPDEAVNVRYVGADEMRELNRRYRRKDEPTNVLTFSDFKAIPGFTAEPTHDICLCLEVAQAEATARQATVSDYVALLLVHAFLHATGLDHEASPIAAEEMTRAEQDILQRSGFAASSL